MSFVGLSFFVFMIMAGFVSFMFFHYHYFFMLLSLELMILSLYFSFFMGSYTGMGKLGIMIYFLIFFVSESVLGITLLLKTVRGVGVEMYSCVWLFSHWVILFLFSCSFSIC